MEGAPTTFYVRGMVCPRCILVVRRIVASLSLTPARVELGEVSVTEPAEAVPWPALADALIAVGFALLQPPTRQLAQRLDALVTELLSTAPQRVRPTGAGWLAARLGCRLPQLRTVCRTELGAELASWLVRRRIEAVQAVLVSQPGASVQDVARRLGYSSQAHLCRQFRSIVGTPPAKWRKNFVHATTSHGKTPSPSAG